MEHSPQSCMLLDCGCNVTAASDCCCPTFAYMMDCTKLKILCSLRCLCLGSETSNNAKRFLFFLFWSHKLTISI